jgi:hypothetical protein
VILAEAKPMNEDERELIYIEGMIHGFAIAKGLAKLERGKLERKTTVKIKKGLAKLEKRNPQPKTIGEIVEYLTRSIKRKPNYKIKILQVLMKDPEASPMKVARALDNADIPLPRLKGLKKTQTLWQDVVETRYFKVLFRRASKKVALERHLRDCQGRLELIRLSVGVKRADILNWDTPLQPD